MKKAILSLALAALLVTAFVVPAIAASGDLVYEMTADEIATFLAAPASSKESDGLRAAGEPGFAKDGNGIKLSGRTADWNALDIKGEIFADAGKDYTIMVGFSSGTAANFAIRNTDSPYGILVQNEDAATSKTLTYKGKGSEFTGTQRGVRLATLATEDFTVTSIKVYEGNPPSSARPTGDSTMIALSIIALTLASGAAVFFVRKVKA